MIHLILREPVPYQTTLCRALDKGYEGKFVAWFDAAPNEKLPYIQAPVVDFQTRYLDQEGYLSLARSLWSDPAPVIILGGWSGPMALTVLILAGIRRSPVFIWVDHPHPKKRLRVVESLRKIYLQILDRRVTGFLACGQPTVEHLALLGLRNRNARCFPYWVEIPKHWEKAQELRTADPRPLRILAVGRHVPVKRFDIAIHALARANNNGRGKVAELVLIGDGPERRNLESLSATLGCSETIRFTGWLNSEQVYQEIQKSDVVVVPSSFEPYGVIVLEAMAAGRLVLASDGVIGAHDRNDESGAILLHPVGDSEYLAKQIQDLAMDHQLLAQGSEAARRVAEQWPPERAVSILDEMLRNTKQGRMLSDRIALQKPTRLVISKLR